MSSTIKDGIEFLKGNDPILKPIIKRIGPCNLNQSNDYYLDILKSIISQQLSNKAANSIFRKLEQKLSGITPSKVRKIEIEELRNVGISLQKAKFIKGLTEYYFKNIEVFAQLAFMDDDEVIEFLCKVNGIGIWTSQMFLIFSLNRLDVLPINDVGFKRAVKKNYRLENDDEFYFQIHNISKDWGQYKSIAAWYLWSDIDN